jgi:hypothetical protein
LPIWPGFSPNALEEELCRWRRLEHPNTGIPNWKVAMNQGQGRPGHPWDDEEDGGEEEWSNQDETEEEENGDEEDGDEDEWSNQEEQQQGEE